MVWKHDRFQFNATDPDTVRGWNARRLSDRHLAQILPGHLHSISGNASSDCNPLGPLRDSSSCHTNPDLFLLAQPAGNLLPEWVSWLWPGLFSCSSLEFCVFSFCFNAYTVTPFLVLVAPGLCLTAEIYFPSRFTFSLDNSSPPMQSGIWHCLENCLVSF